MQEEKITGVCVDIPTVIKEAKGKKLQADAVEAAIKSFPTPPNPGDWRKCDLQREGYIQAYMELHDT